MSAETMNTIDSSPQPTPSTFTLSDNAGGGAGRGGNENGSQGPLVVVQQPRGASPPRPAPRQSQGNTGNSLRNGYAAISHSVSGETAAIGVGFLLGGPIGAVIGGIAAPAAVAALMWRSRQAEHDQNSNGTSPASSSSNRSGPGTGSPNGAGNRGRNNGAGGGHNRAPKSTTDRSGRKDRKPKTVDPILDKLGRGLDKLKPSKGAGDLKGPKNKTPKDGARSDKAGKGPKGPKDDKTPKSGGGTKDLLKDRGKQPSSERPWRDRGDKPEKSKKDKRKKGSDDDASSSTARDGLEPKKPNGGGGAEDEIVDAEIVDDGLDPKAKKDDDRIQLVRAKREKTKRRAALKTGKKAADRAARDGNAGDPHKVKTEVIREANQRIDHELRIEGHLLALTAAAEKPRTAPVNYPAIQAAPTGADPAGAAIARQIDFRNSTAFAILRAMAEQIAHGLHNDDDADMADHIVELTGIPNMCKNLATATQEAGRALARTAPLHPSVIKHLNNAAVAARTAGVMSENIMIVFVQAHREDIIRVLDPRIGEERWNIRNAPGTLDAAKLRAAIASAHTARLSLPGGTAPGGGQGGSKLVPASDGSTRKLIDLMKNFKRGHMVNVLSEVAGSAAGVDDVADSIAKLYRRMTKTWPTEGVVDETVLRTAGQVRRVSSELRKAITAAQKAHQRELRLNAKGRAGKGAAVERKWDVVGRPSSSN